MATIDVPQKMEEPVNPDGVVNLAYSEQPQPERMETPPNGMAAMLRGGFGAGVGAVNVEIELYQFLSLIHI